MLHILEKAPRKGYRVPRVGPPQEVLDAVHPTGFELLDVTGAHAARVATLPPRHRDPFDRLLVAQALVEPLVLVTHDEALAGYGDLVRLL